MKDRSAMRGLLCVMICFLFVACGAKAQAVTESREQALNVSLDTVKAGTPVLVGKLDCNGGKLFYDVSAKDGMGLFVGLYPEKELPDGSITWERYMEGIFSFIGDEKTINVSEGVSDLSGTYYVYIGSSGTDLSNVTGSVSYSSTGNSR